MNRLVFFLWILLSGIVLLVVLGLRLQSRNKQLIRENNTLVLQNDSVLSVNLQLEKDLEALQQQLDSTQHVLIVK